MAVIWREKKYGRLALGGSSKIGYRSVWVCVSVFVWLVCVFTAEFCLTLIVLLFLQLNANVKFEPTVSTTIHEREWLAFIFIFLDE